ncbi:hypothetical protein HZF05_07695 [Sphingomonas sp. CGMCC 1.13654]|uniref:Sarcosine oxidase subunit gamma n=1 Tax=Sphingomonas chungangi TaxID=2683589 RepID=A0A838L3L7_9SPHN|nr:sarcosine oxidase subunit gamma family protein [Sphingomonas chungangi]MBA2933981.1 hypothetical protein [Sphingomonas chungangi]MVW57106.1 hypothetical protein [Sphingomonas chungangi]
MDKLAATHPLDDRASIVANGVAITPLPPEPLAELRSGTGPLEPDLSRWLPVEPNRVLDHDGWRAWWMRPGGWLLAGNMPSRSPFAAALEAKRMSLTDVRHAWSGISLSGPAARAVLAKGTPLDLRAGSFKAGHCTRTWCAGFTILIDGKEDELAVFVDSSLARSFWDWLDDAVTEFRAVGEYGG